MRNAAVIYTRESTVNQSESHSAQETQTRTFLKATGVEVIAVYRESASARNEEAGVARPEFKKAIRHAMGADAYLVVASMDRFTRTSTTLDAFLKLGVQVVAADLGFGAGEAVLRGKVARAEEEGHLLSRRTREGQRKAREKGVKFGAPDLKTNAQPKGVEANMRRARARYDRFIELEALALSAGKESAAEVAEFLNTRGHPTARGTRWTEANVCRVRRQIKRQRDAATEFARPHDLRRPQNARDAAAEMPTTTQGIKATTASNPQAGLAVQAAHTAAYPTSLSRTRELEVNRSIVGADGRILTSALDDIGFYLDRLGKPKDKIDRLIHVLGSDALSGLVVSRVEGLLGKWARSYAKDLMSAPKAPGSSLC